MVSAYGEYTKLLLIIYGIYTNKCLTIPDEMDVQSIYVSFHSCSILFTLLPTSSTLWPAL